MKIEIVVNEILRLAFANSEGISNEIKEGYKEYITSKYNHELMKLMIEGKQKEELEVLILDEVNYWNKMDISEKENLYIKDENYNTIMKISKISENMASKKLYLNSQDKSDEIVIEVTTATDYIELLEENLKHVKENDKNKIEAIVSESILDLLYASGQIQNMSLRTGRTANLKEEENIL